MNLQGMAKLRNLLVHLYDEVSEEKIKQILSQDMDDVKEFIRAIYEYMAPSS